MYKYLAVICVHINSTQSTFSSNTTCQQELELIFFTNQYIISQVNPKKEPPKKKRRVTEGVLPNLYCPVQTIPSAQFTSTLVEQLSAMNSDAQILRTLSHSDVKESPSKFGQVPTGFVLSYQQKPLTNTGDIITTYIRIFQNYCYQSNIVTTIEC